LGLAVALLVLPACSSGADDGDSGGAGNQVEVFSWWTGEGEQEGLAAMIADFKSKNPGIEFINAAVSGGAGTNAKAILANRLAANEPPDSYQRHAGKELQDDITAGKVEDLTYLFDQQGWTKTLPKGLLDAITIDGKVYSVPVNIHRSNLVWYRPDTLKAAGITAPATSWTEFLAQAAVLKAKGKTPLAIGPLWTQKHLLENVLLGELGVDRYNGLWTGTTAWTSAPVIAALDVYAKVLAVSDIKSAAADWQPALDRVIDGTAAYNVMGDWADAYLGRAKKLTYGTDYLAAPAPGTTGVYNFLSDSFTLPKGAKHRAAAEKWLIECGSREGQTSSIRRRVRCRRGPTPTSRSTRDTSARRWPPGRARTRRSSARSPTASWPTTPGARRSTPHWGCSPRTAT
jgi:glucose/mannose transport system substrate-binding protein